MSDGITRKDFLNGLAFTVGAAAFGGIARAQDRGPDASDKSFFFEHGITESDPRYYPPALTGMRGSHPGSFEGGHMLRDGMRWDKPDASKDTGEVYDLVIVGGGISGLAAAHFFRKQRGSDAKILILDNHDDFGGHAKRNELTVGGKTLIGYGGTQAIESLGEWSEAAMGLLRDLNIDVQRFYKYFDQGFQSRWHLEEAAFFDKDNFGEDRLVTGRLDSLFVKNLDRTPEKLKAFLADAPIAEQAKKDMMRLFFDKTDYLPDLDKDQKVATLGRMSARDFLLKTAGFHEDVAKYLDGSMLGLRAVGLDAVDAFFFLLLGPSNVLKSMDLLPADWELLTEPYIFHFPDGNASIARSLVRSLIPGSAPGSTMEDIVTARMDYSKLDIAESTVRLRLNSTVVRARNLGTDATEVVYLRQGKAHRVRARNTILACWNMIIPYMCPEMPSAQKDGLSYCVKAPLVYGTVAVRNWKAFHQLRAGAIYSPSMYFSEVNVDFPVSMGGYEFSASPDDPVLLHLVRTPRMPGLPAKDQYRAGRAELFTTPFETFEEKLRDQLDRMLGPGGFNSTRDITGITINRWPHGYAYSASPLWDPPFAKGESPHEIGRKPFGRIAIANADAGGLAESYVAIDQAHRAVKEIIAMG